MSSKSTELHEPGRRTFILTCQRLRM